MVQLSPASQRPFPNRASPKHVFNNQSPLPSSRTRGPAGLQPLRFAEAVVVPAIALGLQAALATPCHHMRIIKTAGRALE